MDFCIQRRMQHSTNIVELFHFTLTLSHCCLRQILTFSKY
jgi:hypothetical protein